MSLRKYIFAVFILLVNCQLLLSQEKNENLVLFDSFSKPNCEYLLSRLDALISEIYTNPDHTGYIVIRGGENPIENELYRKAVDRHLGFRNADRKRFPLIRAESSEVRFEHWISRNGTKPGVEEKEFSYLLPEAVDSILFVEDSLEIARFKGKSTLLRCETCCISTVDLEFLSRFLEANREMNARFVIYNRSPKRAAQLTNLVLDESTKVHKIPRDRLKIVYGGKGEAAEWAEEISLVKVWLVRQKKK